MSISSSLAIHECGHYLVARSFIITGPDDDHVAWERFLSLIDQSTSSVTASLGNALITAAHHAGGMLSRCHHLRTVSPEAPTSRAIASRVSQMSTTSRNERGGSSNLVLRRSLAMRGSMGPYVPTGKQESEEVDPGSAIREWAAWRKKSGLARVGHLVLCSDPMSAKAITHKKSQALIKRVREVREELEWSQVQMAAALGIQHGTYKQYETRTPMPIDTLLLFVEVTGISPNTLLGYESPYGKVTLKPRKVG